MATIVTGQFPRALLAARRHHSARVLQCVFMAVAVVATLWYTHHAVATDWLGTLVAVHGTHVVSPTACEVNVPRLHGVDFFVVAWCEGTRGQGGARA